MSRFISIIIIIALGTGFFVGIKSASPSMSTTAEEYFNSNNLMDIRVQSTIGLTDNDVNAIRQIEGVNGVMGQKFADALVLVNGQPEIDIDGSQISTRAYGINLAKLQEYYYGGQDENFINRPTLIEGTYPTQPNQCLIDASELSTPDSYKIGNIITLEPDSNSDLSVLSVTQFQIVGIIRSPYYVSFERGNSLVGSGKIGTFIYIPDSAFTNDYYSEIYVSLNGSDSFDPFSEEYKEFVDTFKTKIEAIAESNIAVRRDELKDTLPAQILEGEKDYNNAKKLIKERLKTAEAQVLLYQKYVNDPEGSYNEAVNMAANALGIAESEFNGNSQQYNEAVRTYNANLEAYKQASQAQKEKYRLWLEANEQYNNASNLYVSAQNAVNTAQQFVTSTNSVITSTSSVLQSLEDYQNGKLDNSQITQVLLTLQSINPDLYQSISSLSAVSMATEAIALINPYLTQQKEQLAVYEEELSKKQAELDSYKDKFEAAAIYLSTAKTAFEQADAQLTAAYNALEEFHNQLQGSQSELSMAQVELMISQNAVTNDLDMLKAVIANAQTYLDKATEEYNKLKNASETTLVNAKNKLENAKKLYTKLDSAKWNLYNRNATPGFNSYDGAVNTVAVLSNIFPLIFFLVAALVCFTTMTRMIEEERTQMGTMKALGYSNYTISLKYVIYSLFASVIGSAIGIVVGVYALPFALFKAYSIMFTMPDLIYTMPVSYIILGTVISLITTLAASVIASVRELSVNPASLMRPKAPKPGKRVILEKIPFIWKRISFTSKVTVRNLFRKKSRLIMTVLGIGGCTALILASVGFYSSINDLMKMQYSENGIAQYDVQIVFSEGQKNDSVIVNTLKNDSRITNFMLSSLQSVSGGSDRTEKTQDVYLFVPQNNEQLSSFVKLQNRTSGQTFTLDDSGAIITEKFANDTKTKIGDNVFIETADGDIIEIPVANITENYTFSYIYLSENLYQYLFQNPVNYSYAIANIDDTILADSESKNNAATKKSSFTAELMSYSDINAVAYVTDTIDSLNEVIGVLSIVVMIFIFAAGTLAYIVLYNLSNINISERHRELATIKVLGFYNKEVSSYIYRENVVLTIIGIIFGLIMGIFVHKLLVYYCSVDAVMFTQTLKWYSYLIASLLTALFAIIVNAIMHKKMKKIDMVTSLKAIE